MLHRLGLRSASLNQHAARAFSGKSAARSSHGLLRNLNDSLGTVVDVAPITFASTAPQTITISKETRQRLSRSMKELPSPYQHWEAHRHASQTAVVTHFSSQHLVEIEEFRASPHTPGALLITGLPTDASLPNTPSDGGRSTLKQSFVSEGVLTGVTSLLGDSLSFATEKKGEIIHNICPIKNREKAQSNEGSAVELDLHVENAYFEDKPDFLALFCLRQDHEKKALTSFLDVRSVLARMEPADVAELQKPHFIVPTGESHHEAMQGVQWSRARPMFKSLLNLDFICKFPGMKALTPEAQAALDKFEALARCPELTFKVALAPGHLLVLNNRKVAHGRSYFVPRYDGHDRWLQRSFIKARNV